MLWNERAEQAQTALERHMWNPSIRMYDIEAPCPDGACNTIFHYWWMAHAADALVDGFRRTNGSPLYERRLSELHEGIRTKNGGAFINLLYDDMEWMALAWLRAFEATGERKYRETALALWADIKTGWNEEMGGGIAWHKEQLHYKNAPANGPAAILAARLARALGGAEERAWAERIYGWLKSRLVDPATGFVWDGVNREGDGRIDKDWRFTYCQGVFIGACVELYRATADRAYLADADRTVAAALAEWGSDPVLPDEGEGDGGLFKGILVRYLTDWIAEASDGALRDRCVSWLLRNAAALWERGSEPARRLFGTDWAAAPAGKVTLSAHLSGVFLLERLALLERRKLLPLGALR